jgi:hypothetical protein
MDSAAKLLLPGIDYFQVVFTMPGKLSSLALGNRREMFDLLFRSAWRALKQVIEDEQQFEAAASMILHLWNQHLESHIHLHAFVPSGGPSLTTPGEWTTARPPAHLRQDRLWLANADKLRLAFRTEFLKGLRSLHRRGKLKLTGEWGFLRQTAAFEVWLKPLEEKPWVTFIQAPPENSSPEHVLRYLARYLTGGPISDRRLLRHEDGRVTFLARTGTTHGGSDETEAVEVSGAEFVRRWSLFIFPKGYTKTRRYGGYSNHHRKRYMAECRELLSSSETTADGPSTAAADDATAEHRCSQCESLMVCTSRRDRPGWAVVMHGTARPIWYDDG